MTGYRRSRMYRKRPSLVGEPTKSFDVLLKILFCVVQIALFPLQERIGLQPSLEAEHPPDLRCGEDPSPIRLRRQTLQDLARQINPLRLESLGNVIRNLYQNLH